MRHWVRVGLLGHVGRYASADGNLFRRGRRVVCRTARGLEIGQVLGSAVEPDRTSSLDGTLLRYVTSADDLLLARLEKHRQRAYRACAQLLAQRRIPATLVDVEQLFDGQSLFFYFLGSVPPEVDALTEELADLYAAKVEFKRFAETLEHGCGPGCGTDEGAGCGSHCSGCSLATGCQTGRKS
jgi:cell fate regulator YaaT (PSP1 superfamily)